MQSLMSLLNHKKKAAVVASVLALSALTFSGCDASKEGAGAASSSGTATVAQTENAPAAKVDTAGLSAARNTPAVRAAKAVGPSVVVQLAEFCFGI